MERSVFLNKNKSVNSINRESRLSIGLSVKEKLLKDNDIDVDFSLFEEYNAERDSCNQYRLLLKINPICTNVLFNTQTEIVYKEGSDSAIDLTNVSEIAPETINNGQNNIQNSTPITRKQAIRDTEYSHPNNGDFTYHCGIDIFNNHQIRNTGFIHVNKINPSIQQVFYDMQKSVYNTISDYIRDGNGVPVTSDVYPRHRTNSPKIKLHLYTVDTIRTMKNTYSEEMSEQNGWFGFLNKSNIDIKNNEEDLARINCVINNKKPCEYIDLYPDRTLFSFVPKYNEYRKREEKNWDYCITYPYAKDYDLVDTICSGKGQSIRCSVKEAVTSTGDIVIECSSLFRHTLTEGSIINVYYYEPGMHNTLVYKKYPGKITVYYAGDVNGENSDNIFNIRYEDISDILDFVLANGLYYKKVEGGEECEYYFRKYKKLFGFGSNGKRNKEIRSSVGKVAFGETIYGDTTAQVVFSDDIDVSGLVDHHGRPLSEIYFTVIKRNAGYKLWYEQTNPTASSSEVEFSHCFGKVTSGVKLYGDDTINFDYNIHRLHNIDTSINILPAQYSYAYEVLGSAVLSGMPKVIENDIPNSDYIFYGNIVEFNKVDYEETELSPVFHRFNTAQREYNKDAKYAELFHDEINKDDYDVTNDYENAQFEVEELNYAKLSLSAANFNLLGNLRPEGYFYNPHTKISIRKESELAKSVKAKYLNFISISGVFYTVENKSVVTMELPTNYKMLKREHIAIYDRYDGITSKGTYWGEISNVNGNIIDIEFEGCPFGLFSIAYGSIFDLTSILQTETDGVRRFYAFYSTDGVPTYATFVKSNTSFVWRGLDLLSESNYGDELYNIPFANGRIYLEKNINLYVKRQDPNNKWGLLYGLNTSKTNPINIFSLPGTEFDVSQAEEFYNNLNNVCY